MNEAEIELQKWLLNYHNCSLVLTVNNYVSTKSTKRLPPREIEQSMSDLTTKIKFNCESWKLI